MPLEYLKYAIVTVEPAAIEGWIRVRIDFGEDVILASGSVLKGLDIVLGGDGTAL